MPALAAALTVPFTSQAPDGSWDQPWADACEETSIAMVDAFYDGKSSLSKEDAKKRILSAFAKKEAYFGESKDETAEEMVATINFFYPWEAHVAKNPSLAQIKAELDAGRPVIMPLHGPELKNPHFRRHADYHVIVISGYDDSAKSFITREPGTRYGLDFKYSYDTIMNAMHNFVEGNTVSGAKVAVFTSPAVAASAKVDGDNDGLTKSAELAHGTALDNADTDADGFADGAEVAAGYMPTINETALPDGTLMKHEGDPKVYLLDLGKKRHILSEVVFMANGWQWKSIVVVSKRFIESIANGIAVTK